MRSLFLGAVMALTAACATARRAPSDYDGGLDLPETTSDSATFVKLTIRNHRTHDAIDPTFYLIGTGRYSLGQVHGFNGETSQFVETRWFGPDGCFVIIAHYFGAGNFVFQKTCWRSGQVIDVSLDNIFNSGAAWAHP